VFPSAAFRNDSTSASRTNRSTGSVKPPWTGIKSAIAPSLPSQKLFELICGRTPTAGHAAKNNPFSRGGRARATLATSLPASVKRLSGHRFIHDFTRGSEPTGASSSLAPKRERRIVLALDFKHDQIRRETL